jgi:hypothetical protein
MMWVVRFAVRTACALACCTLFAACGDTENATPPTPSRASFEQDAYPVLLRDCAFPACHASSDRFLQIYGPGRVRMDATLDVYDPATPQEVEYSYERARSMLQPAPDTMQSLLLRKPLEVSAGGAGHKGADTFGRNVYRSKNDPGYQALATWALSENAATPAAVR